MFDLVGTVFFTFLIGFRRASRHELRDGRVRVGSILVCLVVFSALFFWKVSWFDSVEPSSRTGFLLTTILVSGIIGGLSLAAILIGYVSHLEYEEKERIRREELIAKGIDPDKGCFVATFAFENAESIEVARLRSWRDRVLMRSTCGVGFAHVYYRVSPHLVRLLSPYPFTKKFIRWLLRLLLLLLRA